MTVKKTNILDRLPSPTGVALRVIELADSNEARGEDIEKVLQADPAMAAKIIRLANAPIGGVTRDIARVSEAVRLLGMHTVKRIALSFSIISNNREGCCRGFDFSTFWSDSLARGVVARHVAQKPKRVHGEEAFICGLLSQLGRLAFATVYPDQYWEICNHEGQELVEKEGELLGLDHNAMAAQMMESWRFPASHCLAIRHVNDPGAIPIETNSTAYWLASLLRFAGRMAQVLTGRGLEKGAKAMAELVDAAAGFDVAADEIESHTQAIAAEWEQAGIMLSIKTRTVPQLSNIYQQAKYHQERLTASSSHDPFVHD